MGHNQKSYVMTYQVWCLPEQGFGYQDYCKGHS